MTENGSIRLARAKAEKNDEFYTAAEDVRKFLDPISHIFAGVLLFCLFYDILTL